MGSQQTTTGDRTQSLDAAVAPRVPHRVRFTRGVFDLDNACLAELLPRESDSTRLAVFIDSGVTADRPELSRQIEAYARHHSLPPMTGLHAVPGGEVCKNDPTLLQRILQAMHDGRLCRKSYAVAIGGGAVLDAVGFAAATTHRGVRLVRLPTTTLAQADSGVGVKCGVNAFGKKNFLGVFAVPWAVVNDPQFLDTLTDRDWVAGLSEAVKVGLLKDAPLFDRIEAGAAALRRREDEAALPVIQRSAELHLRHITNGGDPFETGASRPLDFGHWSAHRLEQLTGFAVRHGEAVAIGLAIDVTYAGLAGLLSDRDRRRVIDCLRALGFDLSHPLLADADALLPGLDDFREHLGGELVLTMVCGPGQPVDVRDIDPAMMRQAIQRVATGV
ncbi:MAG: 3-dehydroquinate synthase [Planctomycetes bacterium]|nr:3-dehydroquinate synthase [Planctomycetota bacterium]